MNRLLLDASEIDSRGGVRLSDRRAAHIRGILRAEPGCRLRAGIIEGPPGEVEVLAVGPHAVEVRFVPAHGDSCLPPAPLSLDVFLALPRPKALKRMWPQFAALGVRHVRLTCAERVERCYFGSRWILPDYVRPLLIEGAEQAGVTRLPTFSLHRHFREALAADREDATPFHRILAEPEPCASPVCDLAPAPGLGLRIAVGPEGGWLSGEIERLRAAGFQPFSAGPRTLRSETACIALLGLALLLLQQPGAKAHTPA